MKQPDNKASGKQVSVRQDADFLAQMLDSLPTPIYAKDENARFVFSNRMHDALIGSREEELLGLSDADFYSADVAEGFIAHDAIVLQSGKTTVVEELTKNEQGAMVPVLTRKARMTRPDGSNFLVGTNVDMTAIKKREEGLRALTDLAPMGVAQIEEDGVVSFSNRLMREYFGEKADLSLAFLAENLKAPAGFPGESARFEATIETRPALRHVMVLSSGWFTLPGNFRRSAIINVLDVTENMELKRINNEVSRLNAELAQSMKKLQEAQEALLKKGRMEQMGQLTATIAHELRNPMGAIRTSNFLLERKLKGKEHGVEAQIQRINNGIARCDAIITQLLDFSRTKKIVAQSDNLDHWLGNMVTEEVARLASSITVNCNLGLNGQAVPFDRTRLQRAMANLISNAAEAMVGDGDKPLPGVSSAPTITIETRLLADHVEIEVSDNGPGMTPDVLAKIKEPLFTTKSFGTGLGVPAVEQIAMQHGGKLLVASEPGKGARFVIWLPRVAPASTEAA